MRLIDLDELEKFPIRANHYDEKNGNINFVLGIETLMEYAEALPIAYDTERVIEKLKENSFEQFMNEGGYLNCVCLDDAIEIIREGGAE